MSNTCLAFSPETRATSSASTPRHFATVWATIGRVQGSLRPGRHRFRRDLPTSSSSFSGALGIMYGASLSKRILSSGRTPSFRASRKAFPGTSFEKKRSLHISELLVLPLWVLDTIVKTFFFLHCVLGDYCFSVFIPIFHYQCLLVFSYTCISCKKIITNEQDTKQAKEIIDQLLSLQTKSKK